MVSHFGDYDTSEMVYIPFNTFSSDDPSASITATNLASTDVHIHKDGSTTQRSSANGVTVSIDFDTVTGNHMVAIDLSDNTDAGFYSDGSRYQVRIEGVTVDGATINAWIGSFSIGCTLRPTIAGRTLDITAGGTTGIDWSNIENKTATASFTNTTLWYVNTVLGDVLGNLDGAIGFLKTTAQAEVNTEIDTALADIGLDHLLSASVAGTDVTDNSVIAKLVSKSATADWDSYDNTTDSLEAITDTGGGGPTAAQIADAVWDEAQADHQTDGSFGLACSVLDTGTAQAGAAGTITLDSGSIFTATDQPADAYIELVSGTGAGQSRQITAYNNTTKVATIQPNWTTNPASGSKYRILGNRRTLVQAFNNSALGPNAIQTNAFTADKFAADVGQEFADAVWDEATSGHSTAGTTGKALTDILDDTGTSGVLVSSGTGSGQISLSSGAVTVGTNNDKTGYSISGSKTTLDALNDISSANVNTEIVDALATDTYAEPGQGTPGATVSLAAKIGYLYKAWRNKSDQDATTYQLYNDDASTVDHKATVSDDGTTATKGEVTTGP